MFQADLIKLNSKQEEIQNKEITQTKTGELFNKMESRVDQMQLGLQKSQLELEELKKEKEQQGDLF